MSTQNNFNPLSKIFDSDNTQGVVEPYSNNGQGFGPTGPTTPATPFPTPNFIYSKGSSAAPPPLKSMIPPAIIEQPSSRPPVLAPTPQPKIGKTRGAVLVVLVCLLLITMVGGGLALWHLRKQAQLTPNVTLYHVTAKNVNAEIGGGGIVYPVQRLDIAYPFSEGIISIMVKQGDRVVPNQPLMQLDLTQLKAQILQASNDIVAAQQYLNSVYAGGTAVDIAKASQDYSLAQNRYSTLVAEASSPTLHNGTLVSSIAGIVTDIKVYPGELLDAHQTLITIMDESSVIVHALIPVENLNQVQVKQQVVVTPSALPNNSFTGTVQSIRLRADTGTNTFEAWISVPNAQGTIIPGMSTFVRILYPVHALVVPRLAVINPESKPTVFVVRNQTAYLQYVQVQGYVGDSIIIGTGLAANDNVILVGKDQLQNGQSVHVVSTEQ